MDPRTEVIRAAERRADALARADAAQLRQLLHEEFRWTSHVGSTYNLEEYIRRNTQGDIVWRRQDLGDPEVIVVGDTAVLYAEVTDVVGPEGGSHEIFKMPMTQVWIRDGRSWRCLAGHAGPRHA
jgi:ketosteroid isomerase-like protein